MNIKDKQKLNMVNSKISDLTTMVKENKNFLTENVMDKSTFSTLLKTLESVSSECSIKNRKLGYGVQEDD
ncbi:hypothetical protein LBO01_16200 [Companilactobacillus paralimentarius]|uniref:Uncharacterized protein n=3 Tax=Companilactobacillus bobalius TaxID=2801451 RepID=A0A202F7R1_9LACO|nr:hypothetical protein ATN92_15525 [Companilactobacillus bobalius]KAE9563709.1 hypothetical protein ATN92_02975 [Companilactobacillus bobalius]KRK83453.1 hypothetical protein FC78_GL001409 [Companilactobacillus bobalius DSM 19674]OVE96534.1 hypothetical protein LKACC16343_02201 [Companilactobacillus bobalius]GEO58491.1 hypothetical protein LBO01_16200 [Companilactobacillus paralimentarius]